MLKVTDYMINYINKHILLDGNLNKNEIKVFETYKDLALYMFDNDLNTFLDELEDEFVMDEQYSLLENFFYDRINVFHDESYDYIYLLEI